MNIQVGQIYISLKGKDICKVESIESGLVLKPIKGFKWAIKEENGTILFPKYSFLNHFKLKE